MFPRFPNESRLPGFLGDSKSTTRNTIRVLNTTVASPISQQAPCICPRFLPAAAAQAAVHSRRDRVFADDWVEAIALGRAGDSEFWDPDCRDVDPDDLDNCFNELG
eukprot:g22986.t1